MPWWIWLLLVLFMLAMVVAGLVYAGLHGLRGLKSIGAVGGRLSERIAAMGQAEAEPTGPHVPSFAEPIKAASERYTDAQSLLASRRQAKRERHARQWHEWKNR